MHEIFQGDAIPHNAIAIVKTWHTADEMVWDWYCIRKGDKLPSFVVDKIYWCHFNNPTEDEKAMLRTILQPNGTEENLPNGRS